MLCQIEISLRKLRETKPVILNITNFVTMEFVANALLAVGAAPIMSVYTEELAELVQISDAIYINIGTLDHAFTDRINTVLMLAKHYKKPIIFDPVGAGATEARTRLAKRIMPFTSIVRGNASEIIALANSSSETKGVESTHKVDEAKDVARQLATEFQCTVVVSGKIDFVTDGNHQADVEYGSALMPFATGMGCALTAVIAAFRSVMMNSFQASLYAVNYFTLCGTLAETHADCPASFTTHFIDQLYLADFRSMREL